MLEAISLARRCAFLVSVGSPRTDKERIFGTIDDAEVLRASGLDGRLHEASTLSAADGDEAHRIHDHTLIAARRQFGPP